MATAVNFSYDILMQFYIINVIMETYFFKVLNAFLSFSGGMYDALLASAEWEYRDVVECHT